MFMTVLKADFQTLKNRKYFMDFNDPYFIHKWITSQIKSSQADAGIKFRIDKLKDSVFLYIQSEDEFPLKNVSNAGMELVNVFELKEATGRISFRLTAETVKRAEREIHLNTAEEKELWARKRLEPYLDDLQIRIAQMGRFRAKNKVYCPYADFIGTGIIKDPKEFYQLIEKGVGRGKAFGMGLLLYKEVA